MRLVTMTRDMRPWQAGNDVALPDAAAAQLIEEGAAVPSPRHDASGLAPDKPAAPASAPAGKYLTRVRKALT